MKDIKCPSCGKTFRIDQSSFEEILLQIKDEEFNKQIEERLKLAEEAVSYTHLTLPTNREV